MPTRILARGVLVDLGVASFFFIVTFFVTTAFAGQTQEQDDAGKPSSPSPVQARPVRGVDPVDQESLRERLLVLLDEPQRGPTLAELRRLGTQVDLILIALVSQPDVGPRVRSRALLALGQLATPRARQFLIEAVQPSSNERRGPDEPVVEEDLWLLRKAALALAYVPGRDIPHRIAPLLTHPDRDVRLDAIAALAASRHPDAIDLLSTHAGREKDRRVRQAAERQIAVLRRSVQSPPTPPPAPARVRAPDFREREQPGVPPP